MPTFKVNSKTQDQTLDPAIIKTNPSQTTSSVLRPINNTNMTTPISTVTKPILKTNLTDKPKSKKLIFPIVLLIILLGIGSGYILASMQSGGAEILTPTEKNLKREVSADEIQVGTKVGVADESTFRDDAIGSIEKGGLDGEGSHKLIRPGGADQTAAVTSSIIDLDQFVGRKVHVWGETMNSQKVAWFMDIGKLEVLE